MTGETVEGPSFHSKERNVLFFKDVTLSISEWIPFGQNAIQTINDTLDSRKGLRDSLLTGMVDEAPETSSFDLKPFFTRVSIEDYDMYDWIRFKAHIEYPEVVEQERNVGVFIDKSGFVNYGLRVDRLWDASEHYSLDATMAIVADVVEDTSVMMDALLTQFQRRALGLVHGTGSTQQRQKFVAAITSSLLPEHETVVKYNDGEEMESEINQLLGTAYQFVDLQQGDKLIIGTDGLIFISRDPRRSAKVISTYSSVRALQMFQTVFFYRLRKMWDVIKDLRSSMLHLQSEEAISLMEQDLAELGADIVQIEEITSYMMAGAETIGQTWAAHKGGPETANSNLLKTLDIDREIDVVKGQIADMALVSQGLVDEIQGLRDMLNTLAEKRMREFSKLMTDNIQQGSEAQQIMLANVRASRYSSAALKILSAISAGALGMKIADIIMDALDVSNQKWELEVLGSTEFSGGYVHLIVGFILWLILALAFFTLIRKGTERVKEKKLAKQFNLNIRFPLDISVAKGSIEAFVARKDVVFHNVEVTGHRVGWHHREGAGDDTILYVMTIAYDPERGLLRYYHANTEDRRGVAALTTDLVMQDLLDGGLITEDDELRIRRRMGFPKGKGGVSQ
jgi:hypothetical protein